MVAKIEQFAMRVRQVAGALRAYERKNVLIVNAAALSFYTILSLIPFLLAVFSFLGLLNVFGEVAKIQDWAKEFILNNLSTGSGEKVTDYFDNLIGNIDLGKIGIVGLAALLFTALGLLKNIEKALNDVWGVTETRPFVKRFMAFWYVITLGSFLLGLSVAAGVKIQAYVLKNISMGSVSPLRTFFGFLLPIMLSAAFFTLIYRFVPNARVRWRASIVGGVLSAILFELLKVGYTYYATKVFGASKFYGSISALPVFFIWVQVCWASVLSGALMTYIYDHLDVLSAKKSVCDVAKGWEPFVPVACLVVIARAFMQAKHGVGAPTVDSIAEEIRVPFVRVAAAISHLEVHGWIRQIEAPDGRLSYIPALPPDRIFVHEVVENLFFTPKDGSVQPLSTFIENRALGQLLEDLHEAQQKALTRAPISTLVQSLAIEQRPVA